MESSGNFLIESVQNIINDYGRLRRKEEDLDEALAEIESAKSELLKRCRVKLTKANRINPFYDSDILVVMRQDGPKLTLVELDDDELQKLLLHIACVLEGR